jgi:hypothetical protein
MRRFGVLVAMVVLSLLAIGHAAVATTPTPIRPGAFIGTFSAKSTAPTSAKVYVFTGSGRRATTRTISGPIQAVGFVAQGHAHGTLTLAVPRGRVSLTVVGPPQPAFSALPASFKWTAVNGTGTFAGRSGRGTMTLTLSAVITDASGNTTGKFTMVFQ